MLILREKSLKKFREKIMGEEGNFSLKNENVQYPDFALNPLNI